MAKKDLFVHCTYQIADRKIFGRRSDVWRAECLYLVQTDAVKELLSDNRRLLRKLPVWWWQFQKKSWCFDYRYTRINPQPTRAGVSNLFEFLYHFDQVKAFRFFDTKNITTALSKSEPTEVIMLNCCVSARSLKLSNIELQSVQWTTDIRAAFWFWLSALISVLLL